MPHLQVVSIRHEDEKEMHRRLVELMPALRAFARSFHRDLSDADDLVQETLTKAIAKSSQFRPGTNLKSWLFTIMRNSFYNTIRVTSRERPGLLRCVEDERSEPSGQEWSLRASEMQRMIHRLPADQREALILIAVLGVSYEEAAEVASVPVGTIKSRLNRARHGLLVLLEADSPQSLFDNAG